MKAPVAALMLMTVSLAACSSSDGGDGSGAGAGSAQDALADTTCYVGLEVGDAAYTGAACSGSTNYSSVSAIGPDSLDDTRMTVYVGLAEPPAVGPLSLDELTFEVPNADGSISEWDATVEDCTAEAKASKVDPQMGWTYYLIDISCSSPALPVDDVSETLSPMDVGQFTLVTFFTE